MRHVIVHTVLLCCAMTVHAEPGMRLTASTLIGGSGGETLRSGVVASNGDVFVVGATDSQDFPGTHGSYNGVNHGNSDALIVKLNSDLSKILAAALIGGTGREKNTYGVDLDSQDNAYLTGETFSKDFPTTPGAYQTRFRGGDSDAYVVKFDPDLRNLIYSTFIGGSRGDSGRGGLAVDPAGYATIVGNTKSKDFPTTTHAFQRRFGGGVYDGFLSRLSPDGRQMTWSTYLGGSFGKNWRHTELVVGAQLDREGNVYFTGTTKSADFPTAGNVFDSQHGQEGKSKVFVGKLSSDGSKLLWLTFLGGSNSNGAEHRMGVDNHGRVFVVGNTTSKDFPTTAQSMPHQPGTGQDNYVAAISADGSQLLWSMVIGGSGDESAFGVAFDNRDNVYVAGFTNSTDFPVTPDAFQRKNAGKHDMFLVRLSADRGKVGYATYLGGSQDEEGRFVFGNGTSNIYLLGNTWSPDFPIVSGAAQPKFIGGSTDAFVSRFTISDQ